MWLRIFTLEDDALESLDEWIALGLVDEVNGVSLGIKGQLGVRTLSIGEVGSGELVDILVDGLAVLVVADEDQFAAFFVALGRSLGVVVAEIEVLVDFKVTQVLLILELSVVHMWQLPLQRINQRLVVH